MREIMKKNGITIGKADEDGIKITEDITDAGVYIYYSEINNICQEMRRLLYEYNNIHSENIAQAKNNKKEGICHGGFKSISEYYRSPGWYERRNRRLKMDAYRCFNCGRLDSLEVHHRHYDTLGCESMDDVVTLCEVCHDALKRGGDVV